MYHAKHQFIVVHPALIHYYPHYSSLFLIAYLYFNFICKFPKAVRYLGLTICHAFLWFTQFQCTYIVVSELLTSIPIGKNFIKQSILFVPFASGFKDFTHSKDILTNPFPTNHLQSVGSIFFNKINVLVISSFHPWISLPPKHFQACIY